MELFSRGEGKITHNSKELWLYLVRRRCSNWKILSNVRAKFQEVYPSDDPIFFDREGTLEQRILVRGKGEWNYFFDGGREINTFLKGLCLFLVLS